MWSAKLMSTLGIFSAFIEINFLSEIFFAPGRVFNII